jgi:cytochrome c oxidase assembly factor CtaG
MNTQPQFRWVLAFLLLPSASWAHPSGSKISPQNLWSAWSYEPLTIALLVLTAALYVFGLRQMKTQPPRWQIASFATGIVVLALTLLSPLHQLGTALFSAHMAQHELLMLIAAPFIALGRLEIPLLWAIPEKWRRSLGHRIATRFAAHTWRILTIPIAAWLIHGVTIWIWHVPALYQATLESEWIHASQHLCFLITALMFWWTLLIGRGNMQHGVAVAYVFTTAIHTSILGALLTCSSRLWYPIYQGRTEPWGLSALQDQQLGGLIMWVPAGVVYVALGLWLFVRWLRESDRRLAYTQAACLAAEEGRHA